MLKQAFLRSSTFKLSFGLCLSLGATAACSSSDPSPGSGGANATGGQPAAGGGASSVAGASSGGSAMGGSAMGGRTGGSGGASSGSAGSSSANGGHGPGSGGAAEPGGPCTANCPMGRVHACYDNCPLGACDDSGFFAAPACSQVYPSPISAQTIYCTKGQTAKYCLDALGQNLLSYQVTCANGTPTVISCNGGCGVSSDGEAACGP
ncbi:MAG TPA: hypothetical protein VJV79_07190 [Polyangiaceae bacterium]|nr:hypothetical protein [Polyangiaceae bacterium]